MPTANQFVNVIFFTFVVFCFFFYSTQKNDIQTENWKRVQNIQNIQIQLRSKHIIISIIIILETKYMTDFDDNGCARMFKAQPK